MRLLVTDGRYITLGGYTMSVFKNLSSGSRAETRIFGNPEIGIGMIDADDFISGKDVKIRQIYELK